MPPFLIFSFMDITKLCTLSEPLFKVKCIDPLTGLAIGTSVLGGLGSIFGTKSANSSNLKAVRETNEMNYKINQENNRFNAQQALLAQKYNTNERLATQGYNSPSAEVSRLRAAGVNPLMSEIAAGQSSPQSASPASAASPIGMQAAHQEPVNLGQAIPDVMSIALARNQIHTANLNTSINQQNADTRAREAGIKNVEAQTHQYEAETSRKQQQVNEQLSNHQIDLIDAQKEAQLIQNKWQDALIANGIDVSSKNAQAALSNAAARWSELGVSKFIAETNALIQSGQMSINEYNANTERRKVQNDLIGKLLDYKKFIMNLPLDGRFKNALLQQAQQQLNYQLNDLPAWYKSWTHIGENMLKVGVGAAVLAK